MSTRLKTGDVFQIRRNGRNYIALGKAKDADGNQYVVATLNGNIGKEGKMRKKNGRSKSHVILQMGSNVKRIHDRRSVDIDSVYSVHRRLRNKIKLTDGRTGISTDAISLL